MQIGVDTDRRATRKPANMAEAAGIKACRHCQFFQRNSGNPVCTWGNTRVMLINSINTKPDNCPLTKPKGGK